MTTIQASFSTAILDELIRNGRRGFQPKVADFCDSRVENHVEIEGMFAESKLNVEGLLNLGAMGHDVHKGGSININYVLLADMKPRMKLDVAQTCMLLLLSLFCSRKGGED
uniref:Uncharacterized protein n=1 Tax=Parascaris equorum TaxID=6256 RepID=A0A914RL72_PAREQ